ncbi:PIN domain-containing protein [Streptomyces sp. NPDC051051]|uniref:PIN domain-containing protein n=1 Tax=Streptomyces sp. NPDC051051 TaxID=3155666 RepID=UPI0034494528
MITLDTNVLLALYRFTPESRNELINVIEQLRDRVWIPHHVASEYYARRIDAVKGRLKLHETVPKGLDEAKRKAIQELQAFSKNCSLSDEDKRKLIAPIEEAFGRAADEVRRHSKSFDLTLENVVSDDPVLSNLARILDERVGQPFSGDEEEAQRKEAERRYAEKIPPGYKDASKEENPHGDFFIWEQMLREASSREASLLFVTNDIKEDWIARESGLFIGARSELIQEFKKRCQGGDFLIVQLGTFLKYAKEELGASVSPSTLEQAKNLQEDAGSSDAVEVTLDADQVRTLPHVLAREAERWDVKAGNPKNSVRYRQEAMNEGLRTLEVIERLGTAPQEQLPNGFVRMRFRSEDWKRISRAVRLQRALNHTATLNDSAIEPYTEFTERISQLEQEREHLAAAYEEGKREVQMARLEADSAKMTGEGGRDFLEAERAAEKGENHLLTIRHRIAQINEQIKHARIGIADLVNDHAEMIQRRLPDVEV